MSGMEGTCPLCGTHYYGWALETPHKQSCSHCGSALEIRRDGVLIRPGASTLNIGTVDKPESLFGG